MPKIFVVSLHRSATQSTGQFLHEAGFSVCAWLSGSGGVDHQSQVPGHETDRGWIVDLLTPLFADFDAFKDVPLPTLYRELEAAYPDARFVAIYRDPFSWVRSVRGHCGGRALDPYERVQYWHYLEDRPASLDEVTDERLMQMHLRHHQELIAHFSGRDNFLLADLADAELGAKLSAFLHVDPRPFPRVDIMPGRRAAAPEPPPAPPRLINTPRTRSRFHVLGIPHTVTHPDYTVCAFTQKVVKLCAMLKARGHYVIHYGHADSEVACDEHVSVTNDDVLRQVYGEWDWRARGFPNFALEDFVYETFNKNTIAAIGRRKQHGDFLMATFGAGHHVVCGEHKDMVVCEPGIGYPGGQFAPFKVFESYAILHAYYGMGKIASMDNSFWYDVVIPNYYDLNDFEYSAEKDDYLLFVGRIGAGKGVHLAMQMAEATGDKLIIAGPGSIEGMGTRTSRPVAEYVECVGVAGVEERKKLMSRAKAVLCLSTYLEPFCGVHVEAMLSGTPVISTDWGAFTEYNIHGVTGYRCRTFEQMVWAAKNAGKINPAACRHWAAGNFAMERVAEMYDEYFYGVRNVIHDIGWYADNPHRTELDWLNKAWPPTSLHPADDEPSGWVDDPGERAGSTVPLYGAAGKGVVSHKARAPTIKIFNIDHRLPSGAPSSELFTRFIIGQKGLGDPSVASDEHGDTIADRSSYCEMRAHYHVWKNLTGRFDMVGFQHHRRRFIFDAVINAANDPELSLFNDDAAFHNTVSQVFVPPGRFRYYADWLDGWTPAQITNFETWIDQFDLIVPQRSVWTKTLGEDYRAAHVADHWDALLDGVRRSRRFGKLTGKVESELQYFVPLNMFIARWQYFDDYMKYWWEVMQHVESTITIPDDPSQSRVLGFLSERLFTIYLHHLRLENPGLKVKELSVATGSVELAPGRAADRERGMLSFAG